MQHVGAEKKMGGGGLGFTPTYMALQVQDAPVKYNPIQDYDRLTSKTNDVGS